MGLAARAARHHATACDPNVGLQGPTELFRQFDHPLVNVEGGPQCALRIVRMSDRRTENGHHVIANVLINMASEVRDDTVHGLEVTVQQGVSFLGT